ncbi:hypothetical protein SXCC_02122 [Gluconacetobacter sp. SXCC-1]|nr:hypothetical protein SXCC_02122 [Gluconacetobacter sp. SXCC-1]
MILKRSHEEPACHAYGKMAGAPPWAWRMLRACQRMAGMADCP